MADLEEEKQKADAMAAIIIATFEAALGRLKLIRPDSYGFHVAVFDKDGDLITSIGNCTPNSTLKAITQSADALMQNSEFIEDEYRKEKH